MKRTFQLMAAFILLTAAAAPPAHAFPSSIRPGRPPDPLGGRTAVCRQQMESAPGGRSLVQTAHHLVAEGSRK